MQHKIFLILSVVIAGGLLVDANAQSRMRLEVGYNISMPTGQFKAEEISNTSYRGFYGEFSYPVSNTFTIGLMGGFQNYHQRYPRQLYTTPDHQTISAVKTNAIDIMPVLVRGTYFPMGAKTGQLVQPYLSGGVGVQFVNYEQYLGEFGGSETAFPLALQAGAGVVIPVGGMLPQTGIKIGANYNYSGYTKNDFNTKLGNVGVHAGFVFPIR